MTMMMKSILRVATIMLLPPCSEKVVPDCLLARVDDHEDSVYSVAWSAHNAWAFASLSYSGRLTICGVPSSEKYKILL